MNILDQRMIFIGRPNIRYKITICSEGAIRFNISRCKSNKASGMTKNASKRYTGQKTRKNKNTLVKIPSFLKILKTVPAMGSDHFFRKGRRVDKRPGLIHFLSHEERQQKYINRYQ